MRDIQHINSVQFTRIQIIATINWLWIGGLTKPIQQNCRISLIVEVKIYSLTRSFFSMNTKKVWPECENPHTQLVKPTPIQSGMIINRLGNLEMWFYD